MRAMIRDKDAQTLVVLEVTEASYDPSEKEMYLYSPDTNYAVSGVVQVNADSAFQDLFEIGKVDLSFYQAYPIK